MPGIGMTKFYLNTCSGSYLQKLLELTMKQYHLKARYNVQQLSCVPFTE